ncbi:tRNA pseudouridine synthase Pus10 isoform X5 [Phoenix dactylifera]|nr:tRNA pseudouridine synthase Pus10 isoform X5 [Phoenix dactylifera]XP_038978309.1 tRNA pseudouridine synthase Pus10 isoform X5 [Phoenix dactylifera]
MYMKKKYNCEDWFKDKIPSQHISVKDALRLSINTSLENHLGVKSGVDLFRIRLNYSHLDASRMLQSSLANNHTCKRQKTDKKDNRDSLDDSHKSNLKNSNEHLCSESDSVILRTLESMLDHAFCEHFVIPPEKALKPCLLTTTCYRMPIYIGGRYLKFSRRVSQSCWIIDDERMGEASVEEIVGSNALLVCKGDNYKFHAAGREDIDVRMLGSGRPFLVEVSNAHCMPSMIDVQLIAEKINNSDKKYVRVRNLKLVNNQAWTLMREGEAEKQKQYAALVWTSRALTEEDLHSISSRKDLDIIQRTPIRVLHRRSPLERKKIIHWMNIERIAGSCQYFLLHLCTQAGTYIKEFVHGDLGRTHPSIGSILGCRAEILQLDVTDVKMDFFD